jgi:hypothetical protein
MSRRILLLLLLLATPAAADTLLTVRSSVEGVKMDQPRREVRIWIGGDKIRRDDGEASTILRLDQGKLYQLNHEEKTYIEIPLADLQKMAPSGAQMKVQVTATNETKKIGQWNTRRYKVEISSPDGLRLETTIWASTEVESHGAYNRLTAALAALQPGSGEWARKLQQIEGFPVVQESDVTMGGSHFKTREELVSVETKDAPAGAYDLPKGYKPLPMAQLAQ